MVKISDCEDFMGYKAIVLPTAAGRYEACFVWENLGRSKLSKCNWVADELFGMFLGVSDCESLTNI